MEATITKYRKAYVPTQRWKSFSLFLLFRWVLFVVAPVISVFTTLNCNKHIQFSVWKMNFHASVKFKFSQHTVEPIARVSCNIVTCNSYQFFFLLIILMNDPKIRDYNDI